MENGLISLKPKKTLKVRRWIATEKPIQKKKTIKIAKKINPEYFKTPFPESLQADLVLEESNDPGLFLSYSRSSPKVEVLSPLNDCLSSLSPTNIVGPLSQYFKKSVIFNPESVQNQEVAQKNSLKSKPKFVQFEEKLNSIKNNFRSSRFQERKQLEKMPPGLKITNLKQTNSLEAYERQKDYWKKIEIYLSDKLQKHPEDLELNSARGYEIKKQNLEFNEKTRSFLNRSPCYWNETLRSYMQSEPESPLKLGLDQNELFYFRDIYKDKVLKHTKNRNLEEIKGTGFIKRPFCGTTVCGELEITGKDKFKLEIDAAKRKGTKECLLSDSENIKEECIISNYSPKIIY